jgi:hypothetical protein
MNLYVATRLPLAICILTYCNAQSEEDKLKKEQLETLVQSVKDNDGGVQKLALEQMKSEIKSATSSMTSVPKPLKFLRPHYQTLKERFETTTADNKV